MTTLYVIKNNVGEKTSIFIEATSGSGSTSLSLLLVDTFIASIILIMVLLIIKLGAIHKQRRLIFAKSRPDFYSIL